MIGSLIRFYITIINITINRIPNELLKNCSTRFKQYLLEFLNKILEEGVVPEALNTGKCMLIYKVRMGIHDDGKNIFTIITGWKFSRTFPIPPNHHTLELASPCDREDVWPDVDCCRR